MVYLGVALAAAFLSSLLTTLFLYFLYKRRIEPSLSQKVEQLKLIAVEMESNIASGVKKGMMESIRELPAHTFRETTQSFVKMGSGLVEGGLSSLFNDGQRKPR